METRTGAVKVGAPEGVEAICDRFPIVERFCIIYTLRCNIACAHCTVVSSPKRREQLTPEEVFDILGCAAGRGKRHVTFSGGEVFLFYDDLRRFTEAATSLGMEVDVETNAFWGHTPEKARRQLEPLAEAGLKGLCFSVDVHHREFFPIERSINAFRAARDLGLLTEVNFCPSADQAGDEEILRTLADEDVPYLYNNLLNRGRARDGLVVFPEFLPSQLPDCDSLNLTVHATGDTFVCCELEDNNPDMRKTPVYTGNVRDGVAAAVGGRAHEQLVRAFYDPDSPAYFRRLLATEESFRKLNSRHFRSICDFCMKALGDAERVAAVRRAAGLD